MSERTVPARRGIARNLTLDVDASELLRELAPSRKAQGKFLSALLKAEQARREERARLKAAMMQVLEEPAYP